MHHFQTRHLGIVRLLMILGLCLGAGVVRADDSPLAEVRLDEIKLPDDAKQSQTLADLAGQRGLVVVFVGVECPLVRAYLPRLIELHHTFADQGFGLVAVDANGQDSPDAIAQLKREFRLPFPVLLDANQQLARALAATRTPEAFVIDGRGKVRYRGQIDDQYGLGYQKAEPRQHHLTDAVAALLAGREIATPSTQAVGCLIGRLPRESGATSTATDVTYSNQIARVLAKNCVGCHREGDIAPFALDNFESAAAWADTCVEAVDAGRMPPWFASPEYGKFTNEHRLSDADKTLLRDWAKAGCPEGDRQQLPAPAQTAVAIDTFVPDVVYPMSKQAFEVPASGIVDYQYYAIDPGWTEDKWVSRTEIYAGEKSVVHHVLLFVQRPGVHYPGIYPGELIGGFVPGRRGETLPDGLAFHIPARSKIIFQMHYTPNGVPRSDLTHVGFKFADPAKVKYIASARRAINVMFQIPPRQSDYEAQARYVFDNDAVLLNLTPHMHVRGKSFRYVAIFPDGRRETLLEVPRWDFNWQMDYTLAQPLAIPKGTVLECTATFDNSESNPANPDPSQWITFGEQTSQEMLIGFFVAAEPVDQPAPPPEEIATAIGKLMQEARSLPPNSTHVERVAVVANNSLEVLRTAGEVASIRETREIAELQHVIAGGLAEAKKQGVLQQGIDRKERRSRGLAFLMNSAKVLQELAADSTVQVTKVEPVEWPIKLAK